MLISLTALGILVAIGLSIAMLLDARLRQGRVRQRAESKLSDALQLTRTEKEAERLVALHVQDMIPGGRATLLRSNNSENRLAAVTDPGELAAPLAEAIPSDCLAIRRARTNVNDPGEAELLRCGICGAHRSTCVPTMVGGRVTGSLVVVHERKPRKNAVDLTEAAVERSAPVIASHRALSVAERRAATDGLTGIANARAGHETVIQMVAQAQRSGQTLSAIVADLDHFKQVNDQQGHATGDRTLAAVAATIRSCIRKSDFVARMGGEEFLMLLPDTERPGAVELAEKVRSRIAGAGRDRRAADHDQPGRRLPSGRRVRRRGTAPVRRPRALRGEANRARPRLRAADLAGRAPVRIPQPARQPGSRAVHRPWAGSPTRGARATACGWARLSPAPRSCRR